MPTMLSKEMTKILDDAMMKVITRETEKFFMGIDWAEGNDFSGGTVIANPLPENRLSMEELEKIYSHGGIVEHDAPSFRYPMRIYPLREASFYDTTSPRTAHDLEFKEGKWKSSDIQKAKYGVISIEVTDPELNDELRLATMEKTLKQGNTKLEKEFKLSGLDYRKMEDQIRLQMQYRPGHI